MYKNLSMQRRKFVLTDIGAVIKALDFVIKTSELLSIGSFNR